MSKKQKLYWTLQLGGWAVYILINYLSLPLFDTKLPYNGMYFFLSFITGIAVTHGYRNFILKRRWFDYSIVKLIRSVFIGAAALTAIYFVVLTVLDLVLYLITNSIFNQPELQAEVLGNDYWAFFYLSLINVYSVFLIWSVLYFVFQYFENYREARYQQLQAQSKLNEAVLLNLRNQLNPHFLFNALNSIRSLTLTETDKARNAITLLSDLLRYSLNSEQKNYVTLREELSVVKEYLELEKIRFGERLHFTIEADDNALDALVPPLVVMTLVENAIKHGIGKLKQGGTITLKAARSFENLIVTVNNSGILQHNGSVTGIGLNNTRQRLNILYNTSASLQLNQNSPEEVTAHLQIPFTV